MGKLNANRVRIAYENKNRNNVFIFTIKFLRLLDVHKKCEFLLYNRLFNLFDNKFVRICELCMSDSNTMCCLIFKKSQLLTIWPLTSCLLFVCWPFVSLTSWVLTNWFTDELGRWRIVIAPFFPANNDWQWMAAQLHAVKERRKEKWH